MADTQYEIDGAAVQAAREAKGWTSYRLAKAIGADPSLVWRIEKGRGPNVTLNTLVHLARALDVPLETLVKVRDPEPVPV